MPHFSRSFFWTFRRWSKEGTPCVPDSFSIHRKTFINEFEIRKRGILSSVSRRKNLNAEDQLLRHRTRKKKSHQFGRVGPPLWILLIRLLRFKVKDVSAIRVIDCCVIEYQCHETASPTVFTHPQSA